MADVGTAAEIEVRIRSGDVEMRRTLSPEARDVLLGMLTIDPSYRHAAADVLAHRWIRRRSSASRAASKPQRLVDSNDHQHDKWSQAPRSSHASAGMPAVLQRRTQQVVQNPLALYDLTEMTAGGS